MMLNIMIWLVTIGFVPLLAVTAAPAQVFDRPKMVGCEAIVVSALDGWSVFLTSGDVSDLSDAFAWGGPQWEQLRHEAKRGRTGAPVTFEVVETVLRSQTEESVTVWAEVEARQEDHRSQTFGWDFDMVVTPDGCRVWTVVAAERPAASETRPVDTKPTALTTTSTTTAPTLTAPTLVQAVEAERPPVVRLPAIVAWVIVITLGGVAAAGYLAPRLDRRES